MTHWCRRILRSNTGTTSYVVVHPLQMPLLRCILESIRHIIFEHANRRRRPVSLWEFWNLKDVCFRSCGIPWNPHHHQHHPRLCWIFVPLQMRSREMVIGPHPPSGKLEIVKWNVEVLLRHEHVFVESVLPLWVIPFWVRSVSFFEVVCLHVWQRGRSCYVRIVFWENSQKIDCKQHFLLQVVTIRFGPML